VFIKFRPLSYLGGLRGYSEGAMIWFIKQHVTARVAKATLGTSGHIEYQAGSKDHLQRIALRVKTAE
jgi:hypothetical protein